MQFQGDRGEAGHKGFPEELRAKDELVHEHCLASPELQEAEVQGPRHREEDGSTALKCNLCVCVRAHM